MPRLSPDQWKKARKSYEAGAKATDLAKKYGITPQTLHRKATKGEWKRSVGVFKAKSVPVFAPKADQKEMVLKFSSLGVPHDYIARKIGCSPMTLRKHFRAELDDGLDQANLDVAGALYTKAVGRKPGTDKDGNTVTEIPPDFAAIKFWLQTQGLAPNRRKERKAWRESAPWKEAKADMAVEIKNTQPVLNLTLTVPPQAKPGG